MINKINGFKPTQNTGERLSLPVGVYEGQIIGAKVDDNGVTQTLIIQVEITKGDFAGYYRKDYERQTGREYSIRYKGTYRMQLPDGQNEQHDNWRQHQLEGLVWALEDGNPGYKWDWDENKLRGLKVGLNVREREYYVNKKYGTTTEIGRIESVKQMNDPDPEKHPKVRKQRKLNDRDRKQMEQDQAATETGFVEVKDEKLPF